MIYHARRRYATGTCPTGAGGVPGWFAVLVLEPNLKNLVARLGVRDLVATWKTK